MPSIEAIERATELSSIAKQHHLTREQFIAQLTGMDALTRIALMIMKDEDFYVAPPQAPTSHTDEKPADTHTTQASTQADDVVVAPPPAADNLSTPGEASTHERSAQALASLEEQREKEALEAKRIQAEQQQKLQAEKEQKEKEALAKKLEEEKLAKEAEAKRLEEQHIQEAQQKLQAEKEQKEKEALAKRLEQEKLAKEAESKRLEEQRVQEEEEQQRLQAEKEKEAKHQEELRLQAEKEQKEKEATAKKLEEEKLAKDKEIKKADKSLVETAQNETTIHELITLAHNETLIKNASHAKLHDKLPLENHMQVANHHWCPNPELPVYDKLFYNHKYDRTQPACIKAEECVGKIDNWGECKHVN